MYFGLVSLFNGAQTFMGYLIQKYASRGKAVIQSNAWLGNKIIHTVSKSMSPKMKIIVQLLFEPTLRPQSNVMPTVKCTNKMSKKRNRK